MVTKVIKLSITKNEQTGLQWALDYNTLILQWSDRIFHLVPEKKKKKKKAKNPVFLAANVMRKEIKKKENNLENNDVNNHVSWTSTWIQNQKKTHQNGLFLNENYSDFLFLIPGHRLKKT